MPVVSGKLVTTFHEATESRTLSLCTRSSLMGCKGFANWLGSLLSPAAHRSPNPRVVAGRGDWVPRRQQSNDTEDMGCHQTMFLGCLSKGINTYKHISCPTCAIPTTSSVDSGLVM